MVMNRRRFFFLYIFIRSYNYIFLKPKSISLTTAATIISHHHLRLSPFHHHDSTINPNLIQITSNRLQKKLTKWQVNPPVEFKHKVTNNLQRWVIEAIGASGTVFANEIYQLQVDFLEHFPMEAPQMSDMNKTQLASDYEKDLNDEEDDNLTAWIRLIFLWTDRSPRQG